MWLYIILLQFYPSLTTAVVKYDALTKNPFINIEDDCRSCGREGCSLYVRCRNPSLPPEAIRFTYVYEYRANACDTYTSTKSGDGHGFSTCRPVQLYITQDNMLSTIKKHLARVETSHRSTAVI